jgi:hypothetical protein
MRILLSYATEFDKGEGVHFSRVLARLGHEVHEVNVASSQHQSAPSRSVKGYAADIHVRDLLRDSGGGDLFLYIEPLGLIPLGLDSCPIPTACVISDVHRNLNARKVLGSLFDHVFLYQTNYRVHFDEHPRGAVHWMPYACDTEVFRDLHLDRDLDVAFVGQLFGPRSQRSRILAELGRRYRINEQRYYLQSEIPEVYSRAKIVINLPIGDDLTFRFFEALSCGALLLTKRAENGQEELFREDVHYVAFRSEQKLFDKIESFLRNEDKRTTIASAGHDEVVRRHSLAQRLKTLLENVRSGPAFQAPVRRMGKATISRLYAKVYGRAGSIEAILNMAADHRCDPLMRLQLFAIGSKSFLRRAILGW